MGYESRLYIVNKSDIKDGKGYWSDLIASFNLCCVSDILMSNIAKAKDTDAYFLAGDSFIYEDRYGKKLKEIPLKEMITMISNAMQYDDYRRYKPCLSLLMGFNEKEWNNLVVLHYGY